MRKIDLVLGLALTALILLTWLPRLRGPIDLRWDGGVYYVLGTSLAQGKGYRLLNEPGEIQAVQYPPLFPGLITLYQLAAGTDDPTIVGRQLRATFLAFSLVLGLACYLLLRGYVAPAWAFFGVCFVMLHTATVFVSDIAFADLPFAIVTILFFAVLKQGTSCSRETWAGVLATAAYMLRTAGIALFVAWVAEAFIRRQLGRAALRLIIVVPSVLGWQLYIASIEQGPSFAAPSYAYQRADYLFYNVSYGRNVLLKSPDRPEAGRLSLEGLAQRVAKNLSTVPVRAGETISAVEANWHRQINRLSRLPVLSKASHPKLARVLLVLLGGLVLLGFAGQFLGGDYTIPLYTMLYIGTICLTPWTDAERYWFPLAPMMIIGLVHFFKILNARAWLGLPHWGQRILLAGVGFVLLLQVASLHDFFRASHQPVAYIDRRGETVSYRLFYYRDTYRALDAALDWLRKDAAPGVIVASSMPHWAYLRTGLMAIMPPFERDPGKALGLLEAVPVTYLIVDGRTGSFTRVFGLPAVQQAPDHWESVFVDGEGEVEAFRRTSP